MRIAFASTDGRTVDQHFGTAERYYVWDVGPDHAVPIEKVTPGSKCEARDDRVNVRAITLDGCVIVYATQIGGPAAAKLVGRRIHPLRTRPCLPIIDAVSRLQQVLRRNPPPWLRRAAGLVSDEAPLHGVANERG